MKKIFSSSYSIKKSRTNLIRHHTIYSPQSEVLACQDGGEMFKTCSSNQTRVDEFGNLSRNPPVDIHIKTGLERFLSRYPTWFENSPIIIKSGLKRFLNKYPDYKK